MLSLIFCYFLLGLNQSNIVDWKIIFEHISNSEKIYINVNTSGGIKDFFNGINKVNSTSTYQNDLIKYLIKHKIHVHYGDTVCVIHSSSGLSRIWVKCNFVEYGLVDNPKNTVLELYQVSQDKMIPNYLKLVEKWDKKIQENYSNPAFDLNFYLCTRIILKDKIEVQTTSFYELYEFIK